MTWVKILLSSLACHLARASAGREAGLNSIRSLVDEAAVAATGGVGADLIAAVIAFATAVAMSTDVGGAGPGAGAAAGAAAPGGTAVGGTWAGPKPAAESATSVPHCRQFNPGRKCRA